ncbi:hypothetical protein [Domibacillus iocasae]|uniref:hypothetical protein n=1 Tax=Domibacillus iocasae TaxID=1714016 RepID=UPI00114CC51D|nr:hypothetical protein [Domibacillus iocasae]
MSRKVIVRSQEEILQVDAPARGGGFLAMEILHRFGIDGSKKEIFLKKSLDEEYQNASGSYRQGLELLRK